LEIEQNANKIFLSSELKTKNTLGNKSFPFWKIQDRIREMKIIYLVLCPRSL